MLINIIKEHEEKLESIAAASILTLIASVLVNRRLHT